MDRYTLCASGGAQGGGLRLGLGCCGAAVWLEVGPGKGAEGDPAYSTGLVPSRQGEGALWQAALRQPVAKIPDPE